MNSPEMTVMMVQKKWKSKLLIQGNFHPVTSAAFLDNQESTRLTLLTFESHGMASLNQGWLEATLDRRLMQDDWRGLNEGPHDNTVSPSRFILIPEVKTKSGQVDATRSPGCHLSPLAQLLSHQLNNPPQTAFMSKEINPNSLPPVYITHHNVPYLSLISNSFPCDHILLNLRHESGKFQKSSGTEITALLMVHRVATDCHFPGFDPSICKASKSLKLDVFYNTNLKQAVETSLTGLVDLQNLPSFSTLLKRMKIKTIRLTFTNKYH